MLAKYRGGGIPKIPLLSVNYPLFTHERLIIEDEYPAAGQLEKLIRKLDTRVEITGVLESVEWAKRWFATGWPVDLIFSDI